LVERTPQLQAGLDHVWPAALRLPKVWHETELLPNLVIESAQAGVGLLL
jgi:hypothetical protein